MADYIAYLHKEKGYDYGVSFPDFPGAITAGSTLEEAKNLAREALSFHMKGMAEDGEAIPEPSKLDDLVADPAFQGAVAFLVSAEIPGKVQRFNLTAQEKQMQQIDQLAQAAGLSRSAFMVQASLKGTSAHSVQRRKRKKAVKRVTVLPKQEDQPASFQRQVND